MSTAKRPLLVLAGQGSRHRVFLPALVLVLTAAPMTALGVLAQGAGDLKAFAVIAGVEQATFVGAVLARGRLVGKGGEQYCELPPTTYGLAGSSSGEAAIALEVTGDCRLVVSSIDVLSIGPDGAATGSAPMRGQPADSPQPAGVRTSETWGVTRGGHDQDQCCDLPLTGP